METLVLRNYQEEPYNMIMDKRRLLFADDMGLGKTPTTLKAMHDLQVERGLIVGTKVAMGTWEHHQKRWYGEESLLYGGTPRQRAKQLERFLKGNYRYLITNYALVTELEQLKWQALICDEIHTDHVGLLNPKTATFKKVNRIAQQVPNLVLVTGTPVRKHPGNLWTSLHMISKAKFPAYWAFVNRHCHVIEGPFGKDIERKPKRPLEFREMLSQYMIRRMKRNVLKELPGKSRIPLLIEMSKGQTKLYETLVRDMLLELGDRLVVTPNEAVKILRLRQLLVTPQILGSDEIGATLEALPELLENEFVAGYPAVIFTPFKQAVPFIEQAIKRLGNIAVYKIHGDQKAGVATQQSLAFQAYPSPQRVLICTIKSGASFDAFAASACFFIGCEWSAINNKQAEDRLDRMGQQNAVRCYYFLYKNTVDDMILEVLEQRKLAADWTLDPRAVLSHLKKLQGIS